MPSEANDFRPFQFSTAALPERERLSFCREVFGRQITRIDIEPLADAPLEVEATLRELPGLRMASCVNSSARYLRTPELIADGDDAVPVLINMGGAMTMSQGSREVSLAVGDAVPILNSEPAQTLISTGWQAVIVPRLALAPLVSAVEDKAMRLIPRDNEALQLLVGYLKIVREDVALSTPELRHLATTHVHDLVAAAIGASRDGAAIAQERGVRAARLAAVKADVMAHVGDCSLSVNAVAARHGVTPRLIQLMFERDGITFSQFVLERRLAAAHRMLSDPRYVAMTVTAIALVAGFGDLSHFNRSFRRRYGATPSEVRATIACTTVVRS